jgi:hypothetical protein
MPGHIGLVPCSWLVVFPFVLLQFHMVPALLRATLLYVTHAKNYFAAPVFQYLVCHNNYSLRG